MDKNISIIVFGETAKLIERLLDLNHAGDIVDVNTKIFFEKMAAEGRSKIKLEFDL